jgi:hypothetical protein
MSVQKTIHLNDDAILWNLIDPDKLEASEKMHLQDCKICQDMQTSLQLELDAFKQLSRAFLPKPKRNLRPISIEKTVSPAFFRMKNALVYTFMIMICVGAIFGLWPTQHNNIDKLAIEQTKASIENMLTDDIINNGTYSILPVTFQYIVADEFEIMSTPFYDYVFPVSTLSVDDS